MGKRSGIPRFRLRLTELGACGWLFRTSQHQADILE